MGATIKELVLVSGKHGAGKTSITGALAGIARNKTLADYDADTSGLPLILNGDITESGFLEVQRPVSANLSVCAQCNRCSDVCRKNAIKNGIVIHSLFCDGCGVCVDHCPQKVLQMGLTQSGQWKVMHTSWGVLVGVDLGILYQNNGLMIDRIKNLARATAVKHNHTLILADGPSGIGCATISAISGATLAMIVMEPYPAALSDAGDILKLARDMHTPLCACINKCDLHDGLRSLMETWCCDNHVPLMGEIPYCDDFRLALRENKIVLDGLDIAIRNRLASTWVNLVRLL